MYRMILVDDEPQIRRGLEGLIPWEDYGIELVGEADNGVSAKILIERVRPDIAIVDIRMPQMDGLQLLAQAKELTCCPKFIMLSGFDQFDYVRTAMRLGAKNYLLKPVDPEELKAAVIDVASVLDEEAQKKQQFEQSLQALMNHTLNRMLCNQIEVRELREKCRLLGITLRCNHMLVGIIRPFFDNRDVSLRWIIFRCMDICRERMNRYLTVYPAADAADNIVLIIKIRNGRFSVSRCSAFSRNAPIRFSVRSEFPAQLSLAQMQLPSRSCPRRIRTRFGCWISSASGVTHRSSRTPSFPCSRRSD